MTFMTQGMLNSIIPGLPSANTRNIKIPAAFNKGVAIAGDDMSEVITFTVDRYFDYVDLAGTKILVFSFANNVFFSCIIRSVFVL